MCLHNRLITQLGGKIAPALWVAAKKAPLSVVRCLFGVTKLLSSRLDWRFFSHNSNDSISFNGIHVTVSLCDSRYCDKSGIGRQGVFSISELLLLLLKLCQTRHGMRRVV